MTHYSIEVSSVIVAETACLMDNVSNLKNILVKDSYSVRVSQHETCCILSYYCSKLLEVNTAVIT